MILNEIFSSPLPEATGVKAKHRRLVAASEVLIGLEMEIMLMPSLWPAVSIREFMNYFGGNRNDRKEIRDRLLDGVAHWRKHEKSPETPDTLLNYLRYQDVIDGKEWNRYGLVNLLDGVDFRYTVEPHVVEEFAQLVGMPVKTSVRYHGVARDKRSYIMEPDNSLWSMDHRVGIGREFISPPQTLEKTISDLKNVRTWCKKNGHYTNGNTGLHMNMSVPNMKNLDYLKLVLLSNDEAILNKFNRTNHICIANATEQLKEEISDNKWEQNSVKSLLQRIHKDLVYQASSFYREHEVSVGVRIKTSNRWIEFRAPGNDWLGKYYPNVIPAMYNYAAALTSAVNPALDRDIYFQKLKDLLQIAKVTDAVKAELAQGSHVIAETGEIPADSPSEQEVDRRERAIEQMIADIFM